MADFTQAYKELVARQSQIDVLEAAVNAAGQAMHNTEEGKAWLRANEELSQARADFLGLQADLRQAALDEYLESGEKRPHKGIQVRVGFKPIYDLAHAQGWAAAHQPDFIVPAQLDKRRFEKYVRAVRDVAPLDFVRFTEAPTVAIALDGE